MTTFNPYNNFNGVAAPAPSTAGQLPYQPVQPCYDTAGFCGAPPPYDGQPQIMPEQMQVFCYAAKKGIDVQADYAKQQNLSRELERRQADRTNIAVEKDALGTGVTRAGSALIYSKKRIAKPNLDLELFHDCRSVLFRNFQKSEQQILGISINKSPFFFLSKENWDNKGLERLLVAAGVSLELRRSGSRRDALEKTLTFLIEEARQDVRDVPFTYGWYSDGNQFRRIRRSRGDAIWKELMAQCIR